MMNDYRSPIFRMFVLSLLVLLPACGSQAVTTPARPTALLTSTQALPTDTAVVRTAGPTSAPSATGELAQAEVKILPTSLEQPGKWNIQHPYSDPNAPRLINMSLEGYQLDPNFQVASIELAYRWVGIGDRVRDYQRIEWRGDSFWLNEAQVSAESVSRLVQSIGRLYAQPHTLTVTTHTDDYPFWAIELTDMNGSRILLYSNSNSLNFVPWNVIYNGEIFVQFDGAIAIALSELFTVGQGETMASFWGPQEEGYLWATTLEPIPPQITRGFSGLLPVYDDFQYLIDLEKGELRGFLQGDRWTAHLEDGDVDWLSALQKVEVDVGDGQTQACPLENIPQEDSDWVYWRFVCPLSNPGENTTYHFTIHLTFSTSTGRLYTISGELVGFWKPSTVLPTAPYPEEIAQILQNSPGSGDLVRDHIVYLVRNYSLVDPLNGRMDHQWEAQAGLLGQAQVGEQIVPYTVLFDDIKIEDGKVTRWSIDRTKLTSMLQEVLAQPVTQRFLETDTNPMLNLYYGEHLDHPFINSDELRGCGDLPLAKDLPLPWEAVRGFSFNQPPEYANTGLYGIQVLLLDDGLRSYDIDINPSSPSDAFWTSLLPEALKPVDAPPFIGIYSGLGGSWINVYWKADASPAEVSYYKAMFAGWDTEDLAYDPGLKLMNQRLELLPDGHLSLVNCTAP
jgi:hypothetical protein